MKNKKILVIVLLIIVLALGICIQIPTMLINPLKLALQATSVRIIGIVIGQLCLTLSFAWMQSFKDGINALDCIIFKIMLPKVIFELKRNLYSLLVCNVNERYKVALSLRKKN